MEFYAASTERDYTRAREREREKEETRPTILTNRPKRCKGDQAGQCQFLSFLRGPFSRNGRLGSGESSCPEKHRI